MGDKLLTTQRGATAWLRHLIVRDRIWRLVDARDQVLGRVAGQIALLLQGKHKPTYLSNMNSGDPVVVINARHVVLTGRKSYNKLYIHHSGYPGGIKKVPIQDVMRKRPEDVIRSAVKNMLPKNKLRQLWMDNLRVYMDEQHDHHAQKPVLVPPAHCGSRIGYGGPPTVHELDTWWNDNIIRQSDQTMHKLIQEEAQLKKASPPGLAQALQFASDADVSQLELDARRRYIAAAEQSLQHSPVIVPEL
ncbi:50S ribosomal protein L13 [Gracilariopsis chorda]|uniref:50S ribosomal protein L13 n=1 Tax=Gracilariopsis chorda TaxID=448386 RepID=A0A2V3IDL9_9FLOR|nr:50S ribosomal protein L13 [Gracilariopsis chorda]|eukprot:PXF40173.1 50S ribosomal protein L13 [Gracilariopsis chorda]